MPRKKAQSDSFIIKKATETFWSYGYNASSMDILVKATKSSRHSIYADFKGKKGLFLACLAHYSDQIFTPHFSKCEEEGAGFQEIEDYFASFITMLVKRGVPGSGCFMANCMNEIAPHDKDIFTLVKAHHNRLEAGFLNILTNLNRSARRRSQSELQELAELLTISTQGLWSSSRLIDDVDRLHLASRNLVYFIEGELNR